MEDGIPFSLDYKNQALTFEVRARADRTRRADRPKGYTREPSHGSQMQYSDQDKAFTILGISGEQAHEVHYHFCK